MQYIFIYYILHIYYTYISINLPAEATNMSVRMWSQVQFMRFISNKCYSKTCLVVQQLYIHN